MSLRQNHFKGHIQLMDYVTIYVTICLTHLQILFTFGVVFVIHFCVQCIAYDITKKKIVSIADGSRTIYFKTIDRLTDLNNFRGKFNCRNLSISMYGSAVTV